MLGSPPSWNRCSTRQPTRSTFGILHGIVIVRKGRLVLERYFEGDDNARGRSLGKVGFTADTLHDLRSVSKSIVGLLYGIALADGKVSPPDAPLFAWFPEYPDLAADPTRNHWTIRNLLTMTMGTDWDEFSVSYTDPTNSETAMDMAADRYRFILGAPVVIEPGFRIISTPGHTRGHCVMLHDERFLFSGDHLWWEPENNQLGASRDACWYSWPSQTASMGRLLDETFEWVLPGHGDRCHLPAGVMRSELAALVHRMCP